MNIDENLSSGAEPFGHVNPLCPHFGSCGGCQLQHIAYPAQLTFKATRLRMLLEATGLAVPELHLHPSPPFAYRNRIRLTLAKVDDQLRGGYIRSLANHGIGCPTACPEPALSLPEESGFSDLDVQGGAEFNANPIPLGLPFLPIDECPIAAPILWRATKAILALANESFTTRPRAALQMPEQLELFTTFDESRLQLSFYFRTRATSDSARLPAAFNTFCEGLRARIPELAGAGAYLLPTASTQRSRRAEQPRPGPDWGSPGLNYSVPDPDSSTVSTTYWVPRGAFFQVNRFLLPELLALVCSDPPTTHRTGHLAWDLYAGVGLFSRALAARFAQVTAVENAEPAATALVSTTLPTFRAVKSTTLNFLRAAVLERDRPKLIVLDPPRSGAGPEVCKLLARIAAPTLVYVSCSPQTLPRELNILTTSGYTLTELHLLDLFPQTSHIEAVAILHR